MLTSFILVMTLWGNGDFVQVNTISDYKDEAACNVAKAALLPINDPPQFDDDGVPIANPRGRNPFGLRAVCIPGPETPKF